MSEITENEDVINSLPKTSQYFDKLETLEAQLPSILSDTQRICSTLTINISETNYCRTNSPRRIIGLYASYSWWSLKVEFEAIP